MGQKSNTNSLRLLNQTNLSNNNINLNYIEIIIVKYLKILLKTKGIQTTKISLGFLNNKIYIYISIFFSIQRVVRLKKNKQIKYKPEKLNIEVIFTKLSKLLRNSILEIKVINTNKQIDAILVRKAFILCKKYINNIFDKKFYMCIDTAKIIALFTSYKISNDSFLYCIGKIFSTIHKKNHLKYFKLISTIFNFLILNSAKENSKILGIKLQVSGKLMGKAIASHQVITNGSIPHQTLNKNIFFEKTHIYTIYGVFGFKLWTHTNKI